MKDYALIASLCKDIARHASQLEAEAQGLGQSVDRYLELKSLLIGYCLKGGDFKIISKEISKSIQNIGDFDEKGNAIRSSQNHVICMLEYFLMLFNELVKKD